MLRKWSLLNNHLGRFFAERPFHRFEMVEWNRTVDQLIATQLLNDASLTNMCKSDRARLWSIQRGTELRQVVVTLDLYQGKPVLVRSGVVSEIHSDGSPKRAIDFLSIFPDILVVNLDGAFGSTEECSRNVQKELAMSHYVHVGGGIRSLETVQELLERSARRVTVSTNTEESFLKHIPKERLTVEISVDEKGNIMTHGRAVTMESCTLIQQLERVAQLGVEAVYHNK